MSEGDFKKVCITVRRDQVSDLKARSRNLSRIIRDAIDYYLTLDIGSSDIAVYEIRRDVKKLLDILDKGGIELKSHEKPPSEDLDDRLGPLRSITRNDKDEKILEIMLDRGHENTSRLVDELGYSRTESVRDKLNSLNQRAQEEFGRPLFRYFRSRDGVDYSWWLMIEADDLPEMSKEE